MIIHKLTDNGIIWKLDNDDKRKANTTCDFMMGNGHYTLYGGNPRAMDAGLARCMAIKKPIII